MFCWYETCNPRCRHTHIPIAYHSAIPMKAQQTKLLHKHYRNIAPDTRYVNMIHLDHVCTLKIFAIMMTISIHTNIVVNIIM